MSELKFKTVVIVTDDKRLARMERKLDRLLLALHVQLERDDAMAKSMDELLAEIQRQTTVEDGLVSLIDGLRNDVKAAAPGADQAKIDQAFEQLKANTDKLAASLTQNTDASNNGDTGNGNNTAGGVGGSMGGIQGS